MSTLIVLLPLAPEGAATAYDHLLSPDDRTAGPHGRAPASALPAPGGAGAEVVAVVPAQLISWHQVTLPKGTLARGALNTAGNPGRVRAVLEGLLEDRLLDDTPQLHLALEPGARAAEPVWVAACDQAWLRAALQPLEDAKWSISRIVPELAPGAAPALHVLGTPEHPMLAASGPQGVTLLPLSAASAALLAPATDGGADAIPLQAEPALAALAEQTLQRPVQLQQDTQRWLEAARSTWDLAQFGLVRSGRARAWQQAVALALDVLRAPRWRAARWGLGLAIAANLVGLNAWAWKEGNALDAKRAALRGVLTQAFPQVQVVVDAPVQMERELALLRQNAGATSERDLEALLGAAGAALPAGAVPTTLEYAGGELRLKGLSLPADQAAEVGNRLRPQGLAARVDGADLLIRPDSR